VIARDRIDAVVLDAGNTLVSIDFDRIARLLAAHDVPVDASTLHRAEARARPAVSRWLKQRGSSKADDSFPLYLEAILAQVETVASRANDLATRLAPELGPSGRLWRWVLPNAREGLQRLHAMGLSLAVVSNSDGSAASVLRDAGLDTYLTTIVDSAVVGVEKPDPRVFEPALQALRVASERALYVGDLYYPDVVGARAAGLIPVMLDPFGDWPDLDCDAVRDLVELAGRLTSER
jgi:putative hydrolase of the HAD superfamily